MSSPSFSLNLGSASDTLIPFASHRVRFQYTEKLSSDIERLALRYYYRGLKINSIFAGVLGLGLLAGAWFFNGAFPVSTVTYWSICLVTTFIATLAGFYMMMVKTVPTVAYWDKLRDVLKYASYNTLDTNISSDRKRIVIRMPGETIVLTGGEAKLFLHNCL
ncbi:MAG: hypothetical protein AAFX93_09705 [Verrucomicrobiota bacterium]